MNVEKIVNTPIVKIDNEVHMDINPEYLYTTTRSFTAESYSPFTLADRIMKDINNDCTYRMYIKPHFEIKKVIFNNPATIVYWKDGTKTVVKCDKDDTFDKEKGIALCFMKKALGNKGNYYNTIKEYIRKEKKDGENKES